MECVVKPPALAVLLLAVVLPEGDVDTIYGDLAEEFRAIGLARGELPARLWYWRQVAASIPLLLMLKWRRGKTGRHIGAVILGYLTVAIPVILLDFALASFHARSPFAYAAWSLLSGFVFLVAGGYVAAMAGGRMRSPVTLAFLAFVMSVASWFEYRNVHPDWYAIALTLVPIPGALLGGWLRLRD